MLCATEFEMNWDAIGAVAELVGAVGVIVTLIYLATQVRQNTKSISTSSFQATTDALNQVNALIAGNADLAEIFTAVRNGKIDLTPVEYTRWEFLITSVLRIWETAYYQRSEGVVLDASWQRYEGSLRGMVKLPAFMPWWANNSFGFTKEFTDLVNSYVESE
jgi:hypothetical protein